MTDDWLSNFVLTNHAKYNVLNLCKINLAWDRLCVCFWWVEWEGRREPGTLYYKWYRRRKDNYLPLFQKLPPLVLAETK